MKVLLDTQPFINAFLGATLSKRVQTLLADPETVRLLSAASLIEIAIKSHKLNMPEHLVRQAAADLHVTVIPFTAEHAYKLFSLPPHHRDPFDRMIIATALAEGVPVVGGDQMFKKYRGVKAIW